jgi:hypothetical protein
MDELVLDKVLTELSKSGTDKIEATDDVMKSMNLDTTSPIHSNEIAFLINQGYVLREITPYFQDHQGGFHPARYFIGLTPQGLKFISEGGFSAKTSYAKKTLTVARQSRNWAIIGVGLSIVALLMQINYGSCNSTTSPNATKQATGPTTVKNSDTSRKQKDSVEFQKVLRDSLNNIKLKKTAIKKKNDL